MTKLYFELLCGIGLYGLVLLGGTTYHYQIGPIESGLLLPALQLLVLKRKVIVAKFKNLETMREPPLDNVDQEA